MSMLIVTHFAASFCLTFCLRTLQGGILSYPLIRTYFHISQANKKCITSWQSLQSIIYQSCFWDAYDQTLILTHYTCCYNVPTRRAVTSFIYRSNVYIKPATHESHWLNKRLLVSVSSTESVQRGWIFLSFKIYGIFSCVN